MRFRTKLCHLGELAYSFGCEGSNPSRVKFFLPYINASRGLIWDNEVTIIVGQLSQHFARALVRVIITLFDTLSNKRFAYRCAHGTGSDGRYRVSEALAFLPHTLNMSPCAEHDAESALPSALPPNGLINLASQARRVVDADEEVCLRWFSTADNVDHTHRFTSKFHNL